MNKSKGFTLIELLVVIGIMGILGIIFSNTLAQTLRGQSKVKVIDRVKQNGQVVLDRISSEIRQSERVICIANNQPIGGVNTDTIVFFKYGTYTRFRFYSPSPELNPTVNGFIAWDNPTLSDTVCVDAQNDLERKYLTDTDPLNGISVDYDKDQNGNSISVFDSNKQAGYSDIVTIKFKGTPGVSSGTSYENTLRDGGVLFTTTVQVRGGKI